MNKQCRCTQGGLVADVEIKEYGVIASAEVTVNVNTGRFYIDLYICGDEDDGRKTKTRAKWRKINFCPWCGRALEAQEEDGK
ncbi:MAG: hypothetical protein RR612_08680 [Oscillospiraceae bacterium]